MPGEDFHLSDLARFQAHPRTLSACVSPGFTNPRWLATLRSPGANFLHASGVQTSSPKGCADISSLSPLSLQHPAAVDDEIDAVDALVIEQEFHCVNDILGRGESAAGRPLPHRL
jgi:hypothetical protein